jgi:hypothetical protein
MAFAAEAELVDGDVVTDAGDDVLQDAAAGSWKSTSLVTTVGTP